MHEISRPPTRVRFAVTVTLLSVATILVTGYARTSAERVVPMTVRGVVAGSYFTPPDGSTPSSTIASYYGNAKVCADVNDNGACDPAEASSMTADNGSFFLHSLSPGPILVEISTAATNGGHVVTQRMVFRASAPQIAEGAAHAGHAAVDTPAASRIVVTPVSTEIGRMMEADGIDYASAKQRLAARLNVLPAQVLSDPNTLSDSPDRTALLTESVILTGRFALAAKMVDRHDVSPAALEANPDATGPAITMKEAQQAAMNLERIPRYDHIFIIVLENKPTSSIKNSPFAPKINAYLNAGSQFTSYFATANPSEPNRTAMAAADDFGITDDNAWNCVPAGDTANLPEDLPLPTGLADCTNATNHNVKNRANLFTAMSGAGMTWRIYSESMNPGRDWRLNGAADSTVIARDHVYSADSPVGARGNPDLQLPLPGSLYATKHNETMSFQNVRSAPEFVSSNRTMGGGQWDEAFRASPNTPAGWDLDQLGTDLWSGDVGNLNFLEPDQCDDMHGVTLRGTVPPSTTLVTASDCTGSALTYRGDNYTDYLIQKIQASPVWTNTEKRVAIVIMFDEGSATTGVNSCCGWNPFGKPTSGGGAVAGVLIKSADGSISIDNTIARYSSGNKGHGASIFGVLTNQPLAPKEVVDSDAYSHMSFVRTLQDMFGLADPGDDWSYMNRSKYTESFIAAYLQYLPEYAGSTDPHFDAVRPMNHAFVIPADYVQKSGFLTPPGPQIGPDADQRNAWAVK